MSEDVEVRFEDLFIGDRFVVPSSADGGTIWTKVSVSSAREHTLKEISLREKGFGYLDSKVISFENNKVVCFIPV